jgi:dihydroorotase-like cyclic amidohydrolase
MHITHFNIIWIGGVTTVVDMPLNNDPSTVSKETLELKVSVIDHLIAFIFSFKQSC